MDDIFCRDNLKKGKAAFLSGIGGVSMSALAEYMVNAGLRVSGSDINESAVTDKLISKGINVYIGHHAENLSGADFVVRSAAIRDDNAEIIEARNLGIPVYERARAWGEIMSGYERAICISGTHGKTTTTGMLTHIAIEADNDPTVMMGGILSVMSGSYRIGNNGMIIAEACEYCNSFLNFTPTIAAILNVETDHLDFFKDIDDIKASFRKFAALTPESGGVVVVNGDDKNALESVAGLERNIIRFGTGLENNVRAENVRERSGMFSFDIVCEDEFFARVDLNVPGVHNMKNALAAAACSIAAGFPSDAIERGLAAFSGVGRRFEFKGERDGITVFDDYAHHPSELSATLTAAAKMDFGKIVALFQPHTYTRTKALLGDFAEALKLADSVIVCEIYAARERNPDNYSARVLANAVKGAQFAETLEEAHRLLRETARPGDLVLTIGAGDVYKVGERFVSDSGKTV